MTEWRQAGTEGSGFSGRRPGLEVPIQGRLIRETILFFGPPAWHDALVFSCLAIGASLSLAALAGIVFLHFWFGPAVFLAGLWGLLSTERLVVNLKTGVYHLQVQPKWQVVRGSVSEWDALNVIAENRGLPGISAGATVSVVYHLVLHWKGARKPPMVLQRLAANVPVGQPLDVSAQPLVVQASSFGRLMGLPVYLSLGGFSPNPRPLT